jgi:cell division cycle 14
MQGVERARDVGFLDWSRANFDLAKYEHYEQVINGDWNWIIPGKFIAVSGPTCQRREPGAISTLGAEDYVPIFKREGVTTIVRLNKPVRAPLAPRMKQIEMQLCFKHLQ